MNTNQAEKTPAQLFSERAIAFRKAVIDGVKAKAVGGSIAPSAEVARECGMAAMDEIADSAEIEGLPFRSLTSVSLWNTLFAINDSAFWQSLERDIKNKVIDGLVISRVAKAKAIATDSRYADKV
jgi:hypothetical protein